MPQEIRALSYNIRSLRDNPAALARVIKSCTPDLVLLQEAPRFFRWRKKLARLARAANLVILTGGATAAGPAILCTLRTRPEHTEDVLFPRTPGLHRRGLATAVVQIGTARLGAISTHLSLDRSEREDQTAHLLDRLAALDVNHAIVGADVNEPPEGTSFRRLAATLQDTGTGHTFPATHPTRRIDAIFTTKGIEIVSAGLPQHIPHNDLRAASDHLPVLATLRIPS